MITFFAGTFFGVFVIGLCQAAGQDAPSPHRSDSASRIPDDAMGYRLSNESIGSLLDRQGASSKYANMAEWESVRVK